ncbi:MAG: ABC transporter ATP-binding protein [Proteobacteria bacterium]|nr:ABC transporter ATP-binding protein [Pseudomonadota bacterium]MBI3496193.1 ABC transporter ATP-binding protein [Pseudomonadota bacterium]
MTAPLLRIDGLAARYDGIAALEQISLMVAPGEIVALLGANGAGKSTLLRSVIGLVPVSEGTITFDGGALGGEPAWARARRGIGYVPEGRRIFSGMTVSENLDVALRGGDRRAAFAFAYDLFPALAERKSTLGWQLSGGEQQMLAIARALMARPRLLLLDEPSLGLAPLLVADLLRRVRSIAVGGTAVLLAEQSIGGALTAADRGYVLKTGRIIADGPAWALRDDERLLAAFLGA